MKRPLSFLKTYRQHNLFVGIGFLLGLGLIYTVSIRPTIKQYQQLQQQKRNIQRAAGAAGKINQYKARLVNSKQSSQQAYDRERLLEVVTSFCRSHDLLVKTFPLAQRITQNGNTIVTNIIELEGPYKSIVQLAYLLEQEQKLTTISSMQFFTHKDRVKKRQYLRCKMVLRNLAEDAYSKIE